MRPVLSFKAMSPAGETGMNSSVASLERLRQRRDFLRVAGSGKKAVRPGLVLQAAPRSATWHQSDKKQSAPSRQIGVGFTASKKVGNAVARNRAKRRLREIARIVLPEYAQPGTDYVLIARKTTGTRPWKALESDLKKVLTSLSLMKHP